MIIALGADHGGFVLKAAVNCFFAEKAKVLDFGIYKEEQVDYPDIALAVAKSVAEGEADLGVLLCGTGIGMSIAANKIKGIRSAACNNPEMARMAKSHNNLNIITLGGRVIVPAQVAAILEAWFSTPFESGRHLVRINKIAALESNTFSLEPDSLETL